MSEEQIIGRYEVTAELGRGSMGIVHRAHDPVMDRDVAIKTILLPFGLAWDAKQEFHERFLREAQAAGRLSHPGIVTVYDFNQSPYDDRPFIAMEYVEGPTLHELICSEGSLSPEWAMGMAETLAGALCTAHGAGVVHRDLKPANILVRRLDGVAKIADFGVARVNQTAAGNMYGSPSYFAPECIRGHSADMRSDLFSLAVIFFEALTGKRPFGGKDFDTICHAITHDEPASVRLLAPDLSPAFDRFFERALAKEPDRRFQDATSFREALRSLQKEQAQFNCGASTMIVRRPEPTTETPAAPTRDVGARAAMIRRWRIIGPAALLLVLLSFAAGWGLRSNAPDDARRPGQQGTSTATPPPVATPMLQDSMAATATMPLPAAATNQEMPTSSEPATETAKPARTASQSPSKQPARQATTTPTPEPETAPTTGAESEPVEPTVVETPTVTLANVAPPGPSYLDLRVKNSIKSGRLTVFVDGQEAHTIDLSAESGGFARAYRKTVGKADPSIDARIEVTPGPHTILVRAFSEAKEKEFEDSVELEFEDGAAREVTVVTGRTFGRRLSLKTD